MTPCSLVSVTRKLCNVAWGGSSCTGRARFEVLTAWLWRVYVLLEWDPVYSGTLLLWLVYALWHGTTQAALNERDFKFSRKRVKTNVLFWDVTQCRLVEVYRLLKERSASRFLTLFCACLYGLLFYPEGGDGTFFRKICKRLLNYTVSHPES
jgi:hypothetical protein